MQTILTFLIRLVVLAAGLVFAASVVVLALALAVAWGLRYAFARLTGRPVMPFVVRVDPRGGLRHLRAKATHRAPAHKDGRAIDDVTDVQAKPPRAGG